MASELQEPQVQYLTEFMAWLEDNYQNINEDSYMKLEDDSIHDRDSVARHYLTTL